MGKIRLNLASGSALEKPLVTAFKGANGSYVVLDNELNGSMGLPIILVCKLDNNRLIKIMDPNEWSMVKENLKSIIAGGKIEYIKVNNEISTDDVFYTQLTLPVPSFDSLKNTYKQFESAANSETASIFDINANLTPNNGNSLNNNVANTNPFGIPNPNNVNAQNQNAVENPAMMSNGNEVKNPNENGTPLDLTNGSNTMSPITGNTIEKVIIPNVNIENVIPNIQPSEVKPTVEEPVKSPEVNNTFSITNDIFKDQKEAFMQACENMFDALVQKFEKELEKNNK